MITKALAQAGASKVYIAGRRADTLHAAAASINPSVVLPVPCDVTSQSSLAALAAHIQSDAGYLNLVVANSGIGGPQVPAPSAGPAGTKPSVEEWAKAQLDVPMADFTQTFAVNATSVWYTTMTLLPLLDAGNKRANLSQSAQVIVTSSIGAFNRKAPGGFAYGQSKAAATHAAKQLATVLLPEFGIRVNCLAPGLFPSEMSAPIVAGYGGDPGSGQSVAVDRGAVPLGRTGDESEMGGTVLWMASKAGAYCNGNVVVMDGGRLGNQVPTY